MFVVSSKYFNDIFAKIYKYIFYKESFLIFENTIFKVITCRILWIKSFKKLGNHVFFFELRYCTLAPFMLAKQTIFINTPDHDIIHVFLSSLTILPLYSQTIRILQTVANYVTQRCPRQ